MVGCVIRSSSGNECLYGGCHTQQPLLIREFHCGLREPDAINTDPLKFGDLEGSPVLSRGPLVAAPAQTKNKHRSLSSSLQFCHNPDGVMADGT